MKIRRQIVVFDGEWRLGVQLAPNHVPPDWPDGTPQQQLHPDLRVDDLVAAHPFCLCWSSTDT